MIKLQIKHIEIIICIGYKHCKFGSKLRLKTIDVSVKLNLTNTSSDVKQGSQDLPCNIFHNMVYHLDSRIQDQSTWFLKNQNEQIFSTIFKLRSIHNLLFSEVILGGNIVLLLARN